MVQCQCVSPPILSSPKRLEPDSNGLVGALVEGERAKSLGYNIAVDRWALGRGVQPPCPLTTCTSVTMILEYVFLLYWIRSLRSE